MKKYFLHINGSNAGPYSFEDLRAMRIQKTTPVWYDGLGNWRNAGDVAELRALFSSNASTFTTPQSFSNPASRSSYNFTTDNLSGNTGAKNSNGTTIGIIVGVAVLIFTAIGVVTYIKHKQQERYMDELLTEEAAGYQDADIQKMIDSITAATVPQEEIAIDYGSSKFSGMFNNYSGGVLTVIGSDETSLVATLALKSTDGCSGEVSGSVTVLDEKTIEIKNGGCKVTVTYSEGFVQVEETTGCSLRLTDGCSFAGIYSKE